MSAAHDHIAVRAEGLGKSYRIAHAERLGNLRDLLAQRLPFRRNGSAPPAPPARFGAPPGESTAAGDYWALRDLSFELATGSTLGIVGPNGAGKSTVLRLLAYITRPTAGWAEVRGHVGALLDVGTGFNMELSGRENVYLSGAILGMRRRAIERKFDEIVAFAEIEEFIDMPVKHYSSGMFARIAFAVAVHLDTDILLIDDVFFAVGDAAFQQRCRSKIGEVTRDGRTLILVSHSMEAVNDLCERAMLIEHGRMVQMGPTAEITGLHLEHQARQKR